MWTYPLAIRLLIVFGFSSGSKIILVILLNIRLNLLQTVHAKSLVLIFSKPTYLLFDLKLSVSSLPLLLAINYKSMAWMSLLLILMANLMRKFI